MIKFPNNFIENSCDVTLREYMERLKSTLGILVDLIARGVGGRFVAQLLCLDKGFFWLRRFHALTEDFLVIEQCFFTKKILCLGIKRSYPKNILCPAKKASLLNVRGPTLES